MRYANDRVSPAGSRRGREAAPAVGGAAGRAEGRNRNRSRPAPLTRRG